MRFLFLAVLICLSHSAHAQFGGNDIIDIDTDDLNNGGDIFSDYSEDIDSANQLEDERFFSHGRFYTFSFNTGLTTFTGNRGLVTEDDNPSWGLQVSYFLNFRVSYQLGIEFSKHSMFFSGSTFGSGADRVYQLIEVSMLRPYFGVRYHIDTSNLNTALTYSNPYLTARLEYWYQKNKFSGQEEFIPTESGGGIGLGIGGGLEFPIVLREYYIGIEFLYHTVNFFDKETIQYRELETDTPVSNPTVESIEDLTGDAFTFMVSYIINW